MPRPSATSIRLVQEGTFFSGSPLPLYKVWKELVQTKKMMLHLAEQAVQSYMIIAVVDVLATAEDIQDCLDSQ